MPWSKHFTKPVPLPKRLRLAIDRRRNMKPREELVKFASVQSVAGEKLSETEKNRGVIKPPHRLGELGKIDSLGAACVHRSGDGLGHQSDLADPVDLRADTGSNTVLTSGLARQVGIIGR